MIPTDDSLTSLKEKFSHLNERPSSDWPSFDTPVGELLLTLQALEDEYDFDMLVDVTAIDNGVDASPRFTVVYHLYSTNAHQYIRVAADLEDDENPVAPTATAIWPAADWHERECFDMFGIRFEGHPDLRRILMWDGYPHFPLRKDFPLAGFENELADEEVAEVTGTKVKPAPMAGGPFVAPQADFMTKREPRAKDESWNEKSEKPE